MKKLFYLCAAAAIVAACTGAAPTKVENENCKCLICEACDSFMYYYNLDEQTRDSTWLLPLSDNSVEWSDSLAVLVYEHLCDTTLEYDVIQDLFNNEKLMYIMDNTCWDGLCGIEDSTGTISYFYGAQYYHNK